MNAFQKPKILAVASPGGHWQQLLRLSSAWNENEVAYAGAFHQGELPEGVSVEALPDAARGENFKLLRLIQASIGLVLRMRPKYVITTGAAPGLIVLVLAKLIGAQTVWVDSLANVERISLAGRLARPFTDLWLTQWPHLAEDQGPEYAGSVL